MSFCQLTQEYYLTIWPHQFTRHDLLVFLDVRRTREVPEIQTTQEQDGDPGSISGTAKVTPGNANNDAGTWGNFYHVNQT